MKTWMKVAIPVVIVVVLAAAGGIVWFLRDDSPPAGSLQTAVDSVTTIPGAEPTGPVEIAGTWNVDTATGEFDFESATGTYAGFRITEKLATIGDTTAVGRTGDVTGSLTIDGTTLTEATFAVDLTTITTNQKQRDDKVQSALDTSQFPEATFVLTQPVDLGPNAASGESIAISAVGDLTIHGVTKQVTIPFDAKLVNGSIVAYGSTDVTFSDYDVETPTSPIVVSLEDHGILEMQLLFTKA